MESSNLVSSLQEIQQSITWEYDSRKFLRRMLFGLQTESTHSQIPLQLFVLIRMEIL